MQFSTASDLPSRAAWTQRAFAKLKDDPFSKLTSSSAAKSSSSDEVEILKRKLAQVIEEKANLEKDFMNQITEITLEHTDTLMELKDQLAASRCMLQQLEAEKEELIGQLQAALDTQRAGAKEVQNSPCGYHAGMSVPPSLVQAIEAVRVHVAKTPEGIAAINNLDLELSTCGKSTAPTSILPKVTLLTDDMTPDAFQLPLRKGVFLSRSTYEANDPSEDRSTVVIGDGFIFAGVWDGHGGTSASNYTQSHVFPNFRSAIESGASVSDAFALAYRQTDKEYLQYARARNDPAALFAGTCAVACYVNTESGIVTCGNLGDSRAVAGIFEDGKLRVVQLSSDHSAANAIEQDRVRREHPHDRNVVVDICEEDDEDPDWRVKKICAFTRSIGDLQMKDKAAATLYNSYVPSQNRVLPRPGTKLRGKDHVITEYISCNPEIRETTVQDGFVIIASDGVWDEMTSDEAVHICARLFAEHGEGANVADLFIEETLKKAVERLRETIEEEEHLTLEELKSRPRGKADYSHRSCLHDDITVVILRLGNGETRHIYDAYKAGNEMLATTRELFDNIDADGNGVLDVQELELLTTKLGRSFRGRDLEASFAEMDADGDGQIDYLEFENWWKVQRAKESTMKKRGAMGDTIAMLSSEIEKQKEDAARKEANDQILKMMEVFEGLNRSQLKILYDALDADGNGILDRDEVGRLVCQVLKVDNVSPLLLDTAFQEMDYDHSGSVDFSEFCDFFGIH